MERGAILLGIDIGTTGSKVQAVDADGRHLALASFITPWISPEGFARLDCDALVAGFLSAVEDLRLRLPERVVEGIGITGFAESGVMLDAGGEVLAPVLPWHDSRGGATLSRIESELGCDGFAGITGLTLSVKPTVMKLECFAQASPRDRWAKWLNVPEWLAFLLTGSMASEASLASRTGFFDVIGGAASEDILRLAGAPGHLLSRLVNAGEGVGRVRTGFPWLEGAVVTVCGMDHLVAGVGVGATGQDDLLDSCGTGEALIRRFKAEGVTRENLAEAVRNEIAVGRDVFVGQLQATVSLRSGIGMWRFLKLMGKSGDDMEALDEAAMALAPADGGPVVEDIWLESARLSGIGYDPDPAAIWKAAVEAVQKRARVLSDRMDRMIGPHDRLIVTGGGLRSRLVRQAKRQFLGDYDMPEVLETASRGAALFAAMAAGIGEPLAVKPRPN